MIQINERNVAYFAEVNLLALLMNSPKCATDIIVNLEPIDFAEKRHQILFTHLVAMYEENEKGFLFETIVASLQEAKKLAQIGGLIYLTEIHEQFINDDLADYLEIVKKYSLRRKLNTLLLKYNEKLKDNQPPTELISQLESDLFKMQTSVASRDFSLLKDLSAQVYERMRRLSVNKQEERGVRTNFFKLDNMTNGFQKGDLIILAARPSMGKTALALNLAYNVASIYYHECLLFFSLEMSALQLANRFMSLTSHVVSSKIQTGLGIVEKEWSQIKKAHQILSELNVFIDDTPDLSIFELQSKIRRICRERPVSLIVVDYLQLISVADSRLIESRQQEISIISRKLKAISRETNVPVLCLSQLSRSVEKRDNKRPLMSDLRESGAIEQDADIVMMMYRQNHYTRDPNEANSQEETEVNITKHRNGPTGKIILKFIKELGIFEN